MVIGAEGDAVISHAEPQANGSVLAMRSGDLGVIDVGEGALDLEVAVGGDEVTVGKNELAQTLFPSAEPALASEDSFGC